MELVSEKELVVEEDAAGGGCAPRLLGGGAMLRFGYGNRAPALSQHPTKVVTTAEPLLEASTGYSILLSRSGLHERRGDMLQITVAGTVATVIHDGSLTSVYWIRESVLF